ncbi:MAG TPA: hypothetical protein VMV89_02290 [Candidatus Paceibacterota bacterium]|nr:hypothetical protein [Candidatus Paceibacterota bacterium]
MKSGGDGIKKNICAAGCVTNGDVKTTDGANGCNLPILSDKAVVLRNYVHAHPGCEHVLRNIVVVSAICVDAPARFVDDVPG